MAPDPVLPDYKGAGISTLLPALLEQPATRPAWLPAGLNEASPIVVLVVDGLGWRQLQARPRITPVLHSLAGHPITSVAPTTTAAALSSIVLGCSPAEHGVVGYRVRVDGPSGDEVLNVLRWRTVSGDARDFVPPRAFQTRPPFGGRSVPVVSKIDYAGSGFSEAHLDGAPLAGWAVASSIAVEVRRALAGGSPVIYAYYDGLDRIAHVAGFGEHYDAELAAVDRLVGEVVDLIPPGGALAVTADHGQVHVAGNVTRLAPEVMAGVRLVSGEARFRWLHAEPGRAAEVLEAALAAYGHEAWVRSYDQVVAEAWLGGALAQDVRPRVGDVALVPYAPIGYLDPADPGEALLVCRHGSLTEDEMLVPLLAHLAR
ncbi:MAG: alkaline phosphatase family protein [Acidimicrobiaceae bacterium]|nr:alkaline phosphatase family protein [Acidimicrobiaceae bacterium]